MFVGNADLTLDAKSRIFLPAKYKNELVGKIIICRGLVKNLQIFTIDGFDEYIDNITKGTTEEEESEILRFFVPLAAECEVDSQNRVCIPQNLREFAEITKKVKLVALRKRIELWDYDEWEKYDSTTSVSRVSEIINRRRTNNSNNPQ